MSDAVPGRRKFHPIFRNEFRWVHSCTSSYVRSDQWPAMIVALAPAPRRPYDMNVNRVGIFEGSNFSTAQIF